MTPSAPNLKGILNTEISEMPLDINSFIANEANTLVEMLYSIPINGKVLKGKLAPVHRIKASGAAELYNRLFLTFAPDWHGMIILCSGLFSS